MALGRRGQRFEANVWPGFVDVMTALLLVLIFVLSIFMIIQFVLRDTITGQDKELDLLTTELAGLAQVLNLEKARSDGLEQQVGLLSSNLEEQTEERARLEALTTSLRQERAAAQARIVSFEAQVAGLLSDVGAARDRIASLSAESAERAVKIDGAEAQIAAMQDDAARELSEKEQLNLSLASLRREIDAEQETARLAAARAEAMQALIADLRKGAADKDQAITRLSATAARQKGALAQLQDSAEARLRRADALDARLADMLRIARERDEALRALDARAAALEFDGAKTAADLASAEAEVARLNTEIAALEGDAQNKDVSITTLLQVARQRDAALAALQAASALQASDLAGLTEEAAAREATLVALQAALAERDEAMLSKDAAIDRLSVVSQERDAALTALREALEGRDSQIAALLQSTRNADARLRDAEDARRALEAAAADIDPDAADRARAEIEALTARVAAQAEELAGANAAIAAQTEQLAALEAAAQAQAQALLDADKAQSAAQEKLEAVLLTRAEREILVTSLTEDRDAQSKDLQSQRERIAALEAQLERLEQDRDARDERLEAVMLTQDEKDRLILTLQSRITEEEKTRALEAAAAAALRERLKGADDELTAMTLALEEQRRKAEETLTVLAAARAAERDRADELDAARKALSETEQTARARAAMLEEAGRSLSEERSIAEAEARSVALLNAQTRELRRQLSGLQNLLDEADARDGDTKVQMRELGSQLNAALARELAFKRKDQKRLAEEADRLRLENMSLARYRSDFFGKMSEALGDREGVQVVGDRFVFQSEVLFAPGSAELGDAGRAQLGRVADIFTGLRGELPNDLPWILRVDGHTDSVPINRGGRYQDNWELSQARALSVVRYLSEEKGFPADRLAANGFGEFQPIDPGDSPEARARNRRIELKLTER
jgi:chemotaxis protein MotB